ncbi:hypothetical protein [Chelativorans sp. J32]|uniref:hypothetical protein n=1 Tax=Chelativorans sp. J32 TaxID=935840 RepID=UPI0004B3D658|nr:hypothetical protein [Chelativorans sp. J32]
MGADPLALVSSRRPGAVVFPFLCFFRHWTFRFISPASGWGRRAIALKETALRENKETPTPHCIGLPEAAVAASAQHRGGR